MPSTLSSPVQGEGTPYGFLGRLPIELRNEVYTLVLGNCWNLIHPKPEEISQDLGIMTTSKSISLEAQAIFYAKSRFFVDGGELFDNDYLVLPAARFINAQRMGCLELRHYPSDLYDWPFEQVADWSSPLHDGCDWVNACSYLVALLDRGTVDQEFRLRLLFLYESHDSRYSDNVIFLREDHPFCKILCRLKNVTVEWLHDLPEGTSGKVEMCPYFRQLKSEFQSFLGPSIMRKNHDEAWSCSGILRFHPCEYQAKLCESQHS